MFVSHNKYIEANIEALKGYSIDAGYYMSLTRPSAERRVFAPQLSATVYERIAQQMKWV